MKSIAFPQLNDSERNVLDVVLRSGPVFRQAIIDQTGLTGMSVSRIARSLGDKSLVSEVEHRTGARGNAFKALSINPEAAYTVGVNFSARTVEIALLDLGGSLRQTARATIDATDSGALLSFVRGWIAALPQELATEEAGILGCGFALPGDFAQGGRHVAAHRLFADLRDRDLAAEFSAAIGYPVSINSDSNCATVGERVLGTGRHFDNYLYVHLGHGVGGGLVLRGEAFFGTNRNAGIIGNHFPDDRPRPSAYDLLVTLQAAGHPLIDFADLEDIDPLAIPECRQWIKRAGAQLREKLNYPVKLLDPQAVIIGGRLPNSINQALAQEIDQSDFCITCEMDTFLPKPKVLGSVLGSRAGVVGAATLPVYEFLFPPH